MNNRNLVQYSIIGLTAGWLVLFVLVPNLLIIVTSFLTRDTADLISWQFTLDNYVRLFEPRYGAILWHSLYLAGIATLLCILVGYPAAYAIAKAPKATRPWLLFLLIVPFWTNSLIRAYAIKLVLGTKGVLNNGLLALGIIDQPLKMMYTEAAVIIALVYILLPFMILPLYSSIEKLDGRLLEAARDLGANAMQCFIRVTLPLTIPGIIAGSLLVFLPALGMFYISDLLGGANNLLIGNIIKTQILNIRDWPFGSAASVGLTIFMGLMLFAYYKTGRLLRKESH